MEVTLAVEGYDRHAPLLDGSVSAPGVRLRVLEIGQSRPGRDGRWRHDRMLNGLEFDAAELSLSSFLVSRDRGEPLWAIPVFPRRLFSQSQFWCREDSEIDSAEDLVGRRVGLRSYQTTISVLAKGDLAHDYGVPWSSIVWLTDRDEPRDVEFPKDVRVRRVPDGSTVVGELLSGGLDAVVLPHLPLSQQDQSGLRRMFPDVEAEERNYVDRHGYFPVMHVVVVKQDVVEATPWVAEALFEAFQSAYEKASMRWADPNWSLLAWGRHLFERELRLFGHDPWRNGVEANRASLERLISYSHEQGLIRRELGMDDLFVPGLLAT